MKAMATMDVIFALGITSLLLSYACTTAEGIKFGYSGDIGPSKWGSLSPDFKLCSEGKQQSPINILKKKVVYNPKLESLETRYIPTNATLVDNGFNIMLSYDHNVGVVYVDGKNYTLRQMHWHSPSEHTIDGERFPMELHLVHFSDDGNVTVIAVLYHYGAPDPFLVQIKDKVDELTKEVCSGDQDAHVPAGIVDTKAMRRHARKYFRYVGSFTTPPCTENVIWHIIGKARKMTKEQAAALKAPLDVEYRNNSRPIQPLNGRTVELYDEMRNKNQ